MITTTHQKGRSLRDRLASRGTKDTSFNDIVKNLLDKTEIVKN